MLLRTALTDFSQNWKDDLSAEWRAVLNNVELDPAQVRADLTLTPPDLIFPGRRGSPLHGGPTGSHVFRALDKLKPQDVRAVIIGQDPYPRIGRATGRCFDQGDLLSWGRATTSSLRKILQATAYERTKDPAYLRAGGWAKVVNDIQANRLNIQPPSELFDHWESEGVLLLNAGLSLSRYAPGGSPEQKFGHIPYWKPVIQQILRHLAERTTGHTAFLAWGAYAEQVLRSAGLHTLPTWGIQAVMVKHSHPAAMDGSFLTEPGPLTKANEALQNIGATPIDW